MASLRKRGEYKVRDSVDGPPAGRNVIRASVQLLDDNCHVLDMPRKAKGQDLIERVYEKLDLVEKEYFGLQYCDDHNLMQWVEPQKALRKQVTKRDRFTPMVYYFRVRFYTPDPSSLTEEVTRYMFFLQVRSDLLKGKLLVHHASPSTVAVLGGYIIQSEVDDYDARIHTDGYVSEFRMFPTQTEEDEQRISEQHQKMVGLKPADCEKYFLERCQRLPFYGIEFHSAYDDMGTELDLGVFSSGLCVFQSTERINNFPWASMNRMTFKKKMFFIHQRAIEETLGMPQTIGFRMQSYRAAKKLWKACVSSHTFFRHRSDVTVRKQSSGLFRIGSMYRYSGRTHYQTVENARKSARFEHSVKRTPSKRYERRKEKERDHRHEAGRRDELQREAPLPQHPDAMTAFVENPGNEMDGAAKKSARSAEPKAASASGAIQSPEEVYDETNLAELKEEEIYPAKDRTADGQYVVITMAPDEAGRYGFNVKGGSDQDQPVTVSRINDDTPAANTSPTLRVGDELIEINRSNVTNLTHDQVVQVIRASRQSADKVLRLTIQPASDFSVRQKRELRALNALADLKRKSTTMVGADSGPEGFMKVSMTQLQEGLDDDSVLSHFDQLYRRKPGLSLTDAFIPDNFCRNRYRDIAPYNDTRVPIKQDGRNYINASFVKTRVGNSSLDYIAAQGPLPHTLDDFWQMIWEQNCQLVVMVTAESEGGRVKCERYWPEKVRGSMQAWDLEITMLKDQTRGRVSVLRQFEVLNMQTKEMRTVTQLQYLHWPDHGEPDDSASFIDFIKEVNQLRVIGQDLLVHCSAGVGRTGMYIVMETALAMMNKLEPVYPLEIVQNVRDQRPMVIQTSQQYEFVCRAILRAYNEHLFSDVIAPGDTSLPALGSEATGTEAAAAGASASAAYVPASASEGVDSTDGGPGRLGRLSNKIRGKGRQVESESDSDDSDTESSDSSDDEDDEGENGADRIDDIRLNPLAMDDD